MKKILTIVLCLFFINTSFATSDEVMTVYKHPQCGCCAKWIKHMTKNGFRVKMIKTTKLEEIKDQNGVPKGYRSCHTGVYKGHVFEGHIPAEAIIEFLKNPEGFIGLTVPDMPLGSPGMDHGSRREKYDVHAFDENGKTEIFKTYN